MGTVLLCMGHSNGTGAGLTIGNERPVITFIGDSTLYHAGLPAIINATMHQPQPDAGGAGELHHGDDRAPAHGGQRRVRREDLHPGRSSPRWACKFAKQHRRLPPGRPAGLMREAIAFEGFSVVIANHPCMLKFLRDKARKLAARTLQQANR